MTEEQKKNKELIERYPFLLPRNDWTGEVEEDYDYSYTILDDMPKGWRKAFGEQLCEELREALIKVNYLDKYRIVQLKEKFGMVRIYSDGSPDGVDYPILDKYEEISTRTCIKCGAPATQMTTGWIMPFCGKCVSEFDYPTKTVPLKTLREGYDANSTKN